MKKNKKTGKMYDAAFVLLLICMAILFVPASEVKAQSTISCKNVTLKVGQSKTVKITGSKKKVIWSSNKKNIAVVSDKGKITAKGKGTAVITAKSGSCKYTCKVFVYQVGSGDVKVDKKIDEIIKKNIKSSMPDWEKAKVIHDYLVLNCEYDKKADPMKDNDPWTAKGALINKKAVCEGYATAYQACMEALNIPCKYVIGRANGIGHAWNIIKVSGKWYHVDVTFDDPVPDQKGRVTWKYFCISDRIMEKDHKWRGLYFFSSEYPECSSEIMIKKVAEMELGKISINISQAEKRLIEQYKKGKKEFDIVTPAEAMVNGPYPNTWCTDGFYKLLENALDKMAEEVGKKIKSYDVKMEYWDKVVDSKYIVAKVTVNFENKINDESHIEIQNQKLHSGNYEYRVLEDRTVEITEYEGTSAKVIIPKKIAGKTVTSIGDNAFNACFGVENIKIPQGVKRIGIYAFRYCTNLKTINLPSSITYISDGAFCKCYSLESIKIPNGITSIEMGTFDDCIRLKKIIIPNSVTNIGWAAFSGCRSLTSFCVPDTVTCIESYAFSCCTELASIKIPNSVKKIGYDAFKASRKVKIYCKKGSVAHTYAKKNGIAYSIKNK